MIFDTHCHLSPESAEDVVARAAASGVTRMLAVGIDAATSRTALEFAGRLAAVDGSVGLHPNNARDFHAAWPILTDLARGPHCTAIGETGLDYHWDESTPAEQRTALDAHLHLARELDKPVIIHSRDAHEDTLTALATVPGVRGVIHCFSGGVAEARRALDLGFDLSFAGPLTYRKATDLRAAAAFAPADRIHVETDAPFLAPEPVRGRRNEPAFVVHTLTRLAEIRELDFDAAAALTMQNGVELFGARDPER